MDCVFLAQYPTQTDRTLAAFEEAYTQFHANKDVWIENKSKRNKKSKKSKKKGTEHVKLKGSMDNFNTETMEHLHRPMVKDMYNSTNRREWIKQILEHLQRLETVRNHGSTETFDNEFDCMQARVRARVQRLAMSPRGGMRQP